MSKETVKVDFHQRFDMWGYSHAPLDCVAVWDAGGHRERYWEGQEVTASDGEVACSGVIFWVNLPGEIPRCFVALQGEFFDL